MRCILSMICAWYYILYNVLGKNQISREDAETEEDRDLTYYQVEDIVGHKSKGKGTYLYHTKWKGYPTSSNTWEPKSVFQDSPGAKKNFQTYKKRNHLSE
jgi:hypothetical protein